MAVTKTRDIRRWFAEHRLLTGILVVLLFALLVFALWSFISPDNANGRKDFVLAIAQIVGGAALLFGLYFTARNLQVNQEGQITERFTRAIEQLGATSDDGIKRMEMRLGGIYALERIARDSIKDYGPVMEILAAYIRENAPWPPKTAQETPTGDAASGEGAKTEQGSEQTGESNPQPPPADIEAIVLVFRRREEESVPIEKRRRIDLRQTNLQKAPLYRVNLAAGLLMGANLREANFSKANLEGASFDGAILEGAWFGEANLKKARLAEANLRNAHLHDADLQGATLGRYDTRKHSRGYLAADLRRASLSRANLRKADLYGTDLRQAKLDEVNLSEARLYGADLRKAKGLRQEQINVAFGDEETKLPRGLSPPASWT